VPVPDVPVSLPEPVLAVVEPEPLVPVPLVPEADVPEPDEPELVEPSVPDAVLVPPDVPDPLPELDDAGTEVFEADGIGLSDDEPHADNIMSEHKPATRPRFCVADTFAFLI